MQFERYSNTTTQIDLLYLLLIGFVAMLFYAVLLINPKAVPSPEQKSEFMMVLNWPDNNEQDIDLWVKPPNSERPVFYLHKENGLTNLERDDIGMENDYITGPDGEQIVNPINREVTTVRGIIPGHYVVNVQYYRYNSGNESVPVEVELIKLHPYSIITTRTFRLTDQGEERTAFQFDVDTKGNVSNVSYGEHQLMMYQTITRP